MKIPQIHGRHKIRDTRMIRDYVMNGKSIPTLAIEHKLSETRVYRILYNNREFLDYDKKWEKAKRVSKLRKLEKGKETSKKDVTDILEQLRKEIEGDKPLIDQSEHNHITVVIKTDDNANSEHNRNRVQYPHLSEKGI